MIFYADGSTSISRNVMEEGYDRQYEQQVARENGAEIRYPMYHSDELNAIKLTKNLIPDVFSIRKSHSGFGIELKEGIYIYFESESKARMWFRIFNTDFENKTFEEIKNEYPEEFV